MTKGRAVGEPRKLREGQARTILSRVFQRSSWEKPGCQSISAQKKGGGQCELAPSCLYCFAVVAIVVELMGGRREEGSGRWRAKSKGRATRAVVVRVPSA